jgi:flagellar P-ring protein precursor FlgI
MCDPKEATDMTRHGRQPTRALAVRSLALLSAALLVAGAASGAVRVKDIARVDGVRRNQLIGYGLVVGLNGTGDGSGTDFTAQTASNLLERFGISVAAKDLDLKNVAAVIVTAVLTPFSQAGQRMDVTVSSLGDAESLTGGTLLLTPLRAPNGNVYAVAQGSLIVGGYSASADGAGTQKNHPTVGRIPDGALLERDAPLPDFRGGTVDLLLTKPDFTTANRLSIAVTEALGEGVAEALGPARIRVTLPAEHASDPVAFVSILERVLVEPDAVATVVLDEKTGTVVLGENVRIRPVAISRGNLTVQVTPYLEVSQPGALTGGGAFGGESGARTVARDRSDVQVSEEAGQVVLLDPGESLASLVQALNSLGVSPRDLVAIFQTLKVAGALQAELEIL